MKKKVFISSTCFDLKDLRSEVAAALEEWGYLSLRNESHSFPTKPGTHSHDICLDNVKKCDIFILIIGSRYGGIYAGNNYQKKEISISQYEFEIAINEKKEIHTYVRDTVWNERPIYKKNKEKQREFELHHVDKKNEKVFEFIEYIIKQKTDTWIHEFKDSVDLKENLAFRLNIRTDNKRGIEPGPETGRNNGKLMYTKIIVNKTNPELSIREIAKRLQINILTENDQDIPFVPFSNFENIFNSHRILFQGVSGCGKTRCLYELLKARIKNIDQIWIINPKQTDYEKPSLNSIYELHTMIRETDIVIWDNFPYGTIDGINNSVEKHLSLLAQTFAKYVFFALKPEFNAKLWVVAKDCFDIVTVPVAYSIENVREILVNYGESISDYKDYYNTLLKGKISEISEIIFNKNPTPMGILNFYKEIKVQYSLKNSLLELDVSEIANNIGSNTEYYKEQFWKLTHNAKREREVDIDFLCLLKTCSDIKISTNLSNLTKLLADIFNEKMDDPFFHIGDWIFISGSDCAIHDSALDAILIDEKRQLKIIGYLENHFNDVLDDRMDLMLHFGRFYATNIFFHNKFIEKLDYIISGKFLKNIKNDAPLLKGLGEGIDLIFSKVSKEIQCKLLRYGELNNNILSSLGLNIGSRFQDYEEEIQLKVLQMSEKGGDFALNFGIRIGENLPFLKQSIKNSIISLAYKNHVFISYFGVGIGEIFHKLDIDIQNEIFQLANKRSYCFAAMFGMGIGKEFHSYNANLQNRILDFTKTNVEFSGYFGEGIGENLFKCTSKIQMKVVEFAGSLYLSDKKNLFSTGMADGLGKSFSSLDTKIQKIFIEKAIQNKGLSTSKLGYAIGRVFHILEKSVQLITLNSSINNTMLSLGLNFGVGKAFSSVCPETQNKILSTCRKNINYPVSLLGEAIGESISSISKQCLDEIFDIAEKNQNFASGLFYSLGLNSCYLDDEIFNKKISPEYLISIKLGWRFYYGLGINLNKFYKVTLQNILNSINNYRNLLEGFAEGIGRSISSFDEQRLGEIFDIAEKNQHFASGLFCGIGSDHLSMDKKILNKERHLEARHETNSVAIYRTENTKSFSSLNKEIQQKIFDLVVKSPQFTNGIIGLSIGSSFAELERNYQDIILEKAKSERSCFILGIFDGIGDYKSVLCEFYKETYNKVDKIMNYNDELRMVFYDAGADFGMIGKIEKMSEKPCLSETLPFIEGMSGGRLLFYKDDHERKNIYRYLNFFPKVGFWLGVKTGNSFSQWAIQVQEELLELVNSNDAYKEGFHKTVNFEKFF